MNSEIVSYCVDYAYFLALGNSVYGLVMVNHCDISQRRSISHFALSHTACCDEVRVGINLIPLEKLHISKQSAWSRSPPHSKPRKKWSQTTRYIYVDRSTDRQQKTLLL